jgi:hypothetical protein
MARLGYHSVTWRTKVNETLAVPPPLLKVVQKFVIGRGWGIGAAAFRVGGGGGGGHAPMVSNLARAIFASSGETSCSAMAYRAARRRFISR